MNINFNFLNFTGNNSTDADKTSANSPLALSNLQKSMNATQNHTNNKQEKPTNMDIVSFSEAIANKLRSMVEEYRPESMQFEEKSEETTTDQILKDMVEKGKPIEELFEYIDVSKAKETEKTRLVPGEAASRLYEARDCISQVRSDLDSMNRLAEELDKNADKYTASDRLMFQKEIDKLKKNMNDINAHLDKKYDGLSPFQMSAEAMGVDQVNIADKESMPEARNAINAGMDNARALAEKIDKMIEKMEEEYFKRLQGKASDILQQTEEQQAKAEEITIFEISINESVSINDVIGAKSDSPAETGTASHAPSDTSGGE